MMRVCKKEEFVDVNQDVRSSPKQEECGPTQLKEEPAELLTTSELRLKQEFEWTSKESFVESEVNVPLIASAVPLCNCQLQKCNVNSNDPQSQDQKR